VLSVQATPANIIGFLYNTCISNTAAALNDTVNGPAAFISPVVTNTSTGVCGPRAAGTGLAPGGLPLAGSGYVNKDGNNLSIPGGTPRIFWNFANTQTGDIDTSYASSVGFAKNDVYGLSFTGDWKLGDALLLKSITGYRQISWHVGIDLDGLPELIQEVTDSQHQYQVSQEFQLNGTAFSDKLDYVAGLYYFKEKGYVHDFVPFQGILYVYDIQNDVDTESYAGYLHTNYKVTDQFTVTLGGRYSHEKKEFIGGQADLDGFTYKISGCNPPSDPANLHLDPSIPPGVTCQAALGFPVADQPLRYFPTGVNTQEFNVFTPRIGGQFQINDDVMAYASWSKGFKSGGWTTRLSVPIQSGEQAEFGPEFAKTTEIGLKTELADRRVLLNTAVFYTNYDGIQLNFQEGASPVLHNAGDAKIKGIEVEMQAILGAGFGLNAAAGYIDADYTKIAPEAQIPITNKLPKTPKYKYNVSPTYDVKLANGAGMRFGVDYTRTAELFNDSLNTPELRRPATNSVGAAIHYAPESENWEVVLGGTNLTNDRWLTVGSINLAAGEMVGTYNAPKQWYLTGRVKFGAK
jgi:iron complex outermembrane receptor protein